MTARREFVLTDEQHARLLDACKPVPYLVAGGREPLSPQENANAMWAVLGQEMGFDPMSVEPVAGKNDHHFTANALPVLPIETEWTQGECGCRLVCAAHRRLVAGNSK